MLTRLRFPDGPVFSDRGRICLIHDTAEGRWGATAQLTHRRHPSSPRPGFADAAFDAHVRAAGS